MTRPTRERPWLLPALFATGLAIATLMTWRMHVGIDALDLLTFIEQWRMGEPTADRNGDGRFTGRDVSDFVHTWQVGCP